MLIYKALQVVALTRREPKTWEMNGKTGTVHAASMAVIGSDAGVASITLKAKTAEELNAKAAKYTLGKPAEIQILEIVPVFKSGDRKAASYEFTA